MCLSFTRTGVGNYTDPDVTDGGLPDILGGWCGACVGNDHRYDGELVPATRLEIVVVDGNGTVFFEFFEFYQFARRFFYRKTVACDRLHGIAMVAVFVSGFQHCRLGKEILPSPVFFCRCTSTVMADVSIHEK